MISVNSGRSISYSGLLPANVLDLSQWTLGLPTNSAGELYYDTFIYDANGNLVANPNGNATRSSLRNISAAELQTYSSNVFFVRQVNGVNEVNFVSPVFGSVSSPTTLSNHTRCELRGLIHGTGASATEFRKANQPRLRGTCVVRDVPQANGDIDLFQIHGLTTFFLIVVRRANGTIESSMTPYNGGGTGATGTANISGGKVTSVTVLNQGAGFTDPPPVDFSGGGGSGAAGTAVISGGKVTSVTITNQGSGYTSAPTVRIGGLGRTVVNIATNTQIGDLIDYELVFGPDDVARYKIRVNGGPQNTFQHATDPVWGTKDLYFKAGAYSGSDPQESADYPNVRNGLLDTTQFPVTDAGWIAYRSLVQDLLVP